MIPRNEILATTTAVLLSCAPKHTSPDVDLDAKVAEEREFILARTTALLDFPDTSVFDEDAPAPPIPSVPDEDNDGYDASVDCNDHDYNVHPVPSYRSQEYTDRYGIDCIYSHERDLGLIDGIDNDCDGSIDYTFSKYIPAVPEPKNLKLSPFLNGYNAITDQPLGSFLQLQMINTWFGFGDRDFYVYKNSFLPSHIADREFDIVAGWLVGELMTQPGLANMLIADAQPALREYYAAIPLKGQIDKGLDYVYKYTRNFDGAREAAYLSELRRQDEQYEEHGQDDFGKFNGHYLQKHEPGCFEKLILPAPHTRDDIWIDGNIYIGECEEMFIMADPSSDLAKFTYNEARPLGAWIYRRARENNLTDAEIRALAPVVANLKRALRGY